MPKRFNMKSNGSSSSTISDSVVEFVLTRDIKDFETLNVSSIAREFKINRSYLSQRFKYDKKYSLHEYILMIKLLRALSLLESSSDITIEELSKKMGFANADYFRRVFKERIGTTPGKYKSLFNKRRCIKEVT
jgi:two-component system response regulator YesN